MINITVPLPLQITEDGSVVFKSGKENLIKNSSNGAIEGLTESSKKIIQEYNLNSPLEIEFRNKLELLKAYNASNPQERNHPIEYFHNALRQIATLNRNSHKHARNTDNLLRSVLYANTITALESFFSDYLIYYVLKDDEIIKRLGKNYDPFKTEKYSLKDLITESKTAKELAIEKIKDLVLHNLNTVKSIYTAAFEISFPKFGNLTIAIENRHDIVHRNGYKKESNNPEKYSKDDVLILIIEVQKFSIAVLDEIKNKAL